LISSNIGKGSQTRTVTLKKKRKEKNQERKTKATSLDSKVLYYLDLRKKWTCMFKIFSPRYLSTVESGNRTRYGMYCRNKGHFGDFQKVSVSDVSFPS